VGGILSILQPPAAVRVPDLPLQAGPSIWSLDALIRRSSAHPEPGFLMGGPASSIQRRWRSCARSTPAGRSRMSTNARTATACHPLWNAPRRCRPPGTAAWSLLTAVIGSRRPGDVDEIGGLDAPRGAGRWCWRARWTP